MVLRSSYETTNREFIESNQNNSLETMDFVLQKLNGACTERSDKARDGEKNYIYGVQWTIWKYLLKMVL